MFTILIYRTQKSKKYTKHITKKAQSVSWFSTTLFAPLTLDSRVARILVAGVFALAIVFSQAAYLLSAQAAQPYGSVAYVRLVDRLGADGQSRYSKIFTSSTTGGGELRVSNQGDYDDVYPSYSPDGTKIVFVSNRDGWRSEIYVMNRDGSNQVRLTHADAANSQKYNPSFSPNGSAIIFSEIEDGGGDLPIIKTVSANGGTPAAVMTGDEENPFSFEFPLIGRYASYSPDGSKILYTHSDNIYTYEASEDTVETIVDDAYMNTKPSYSPDGSKIVFLTLRSSVTQVHAVAAAGGGTTALTNYTAQDNLNPNNPKYSPDGSRIIFDGLVSDAGNDRAHFTIPVQGGGETQVPYAGDSAGNLSFSPVMVQVTNATTNNGHDTLTVTENLTSQGYILVNQTLTIGEGGSTGNVIVGDKGILKGVGTAGVVAVASGGTLAPGTSPGCLAAGNTSFANGSTFDIEIGGTVACSGYDKLNVTGTVNVTGATLKVSLYNNFAPVVGSTFTIIDNDSNDAVTGTFNGSPEGGEYTQGGYTYQVSYIGGDGNDVTLKLTKIDPAAVAAANAPKTPNTGLAALLANPAATMAITVVCAAALYVFSRNKMFAKWR